MSVANMSPVSRVALALLSAVFLLLAPEPARAQSESPWTPPVIIAQTEGQLSASVLVPDDLGRLHLFYPEQPDESQTGFINYMQWDGTSWSQPIDVIIDPEATMPDSLRAVIDTQQVMHLVWHGGNNGLRYASAPVNGVGLAQMWSTPVTIASAIGAHDVLADLDGNLYVAYATWPETGAIEVISSFDGGASWGMPVTAIVTPQDTVPHEIRLAKNGAGPLHMTWTTYELPDGWPAIGAFYAQSLDDGATWTSEQQMAPPYHGQIGVGTLGDDEVHLVWRSNIGGDGTFHQRSTDRGITWLDPNQYDDKGGFSGLPSFAVDSSGRMHYMIGPGYHARWDDDGLSRYTDIVTPEVRNSAATSNGEQAVMAITLGNQLHVVFETDFTALWYTSKQLDLPPLPTPTVASAPIIQQESSAPAVMPTVSSPPTPTSIPNLQEFSRNDAGSPRSSSFAVIFGVVPALLLVGTVVVAALMRRKS